MLFKKPADSHEDHSISFADVFTRELEVIAAARVKREVPKRNRPLAEDLVGLSFSGGGIRSATFNLGVIQALAKSNLLGLVDYLSTVSGGGYIGSWMTSWAYYVSRRTGSPSTNHIAAIEAALNQTPRKIGELSEPPQVHFLRRYSNYLTPRLGALSGDTLAFIGTYLRNLLLNQIILIAALLSLLLVPRAIGLAFDKFTGQTGIATCILLSFTLLAASFLRVLRNVDPQRADSSRVVVLTIAVPLFVFCLVIAYLLWQIVYEGVVSIPLSRQTQILIVLLTTLSYVALWTLATIFIGRAPASPSATSAKLEPPSTYLHWAPAIWATPAGIVAGLSILTGIAILNRLVDLHPNTGGWLWLVAFGVPIAAALVLFVGVVHLGLIGRAYEDALREWWARLGGVVLAIALLWFFLSLTTLFIPSWLQMFVAYLRNGDTRWLTRVWKLLSTLGITSLVAAWIAGTFKGLFAAKSPQTGPQPESSGNSSNQAADLAARLGPPIFAVGLIIVLAVSLYFAVPMQTTKLYAVLLLLLFLYGLSRFFGYRVDVNEFSLHNAYRNRIVRCYLGATNEDRKPQLFTGFDDSDNIYLDSLLDLGAPFHILNATLNAVKGKELALQARKARAFAFTPLYSGFDYVAGPADDPGSYRLTKNCSWHSRYPGARLGTAMAISGAAASPNMGHYTSGAVAFLLTIFSVRLGWWLGNPRIKKAWESGQPRSSWRALINELTGNTNEDQNEVYLSDGGHFENLGIYELVRRRCRLIIASDAGADPARVCNDLASAIEKCRVDFGTQIEIKVEDVQPTVKLLPGDQGFRASKTPFVIGTVHYPDDRKGLLIYLKPSLFADLPQDVLAYARLAQAFPHQSTIDQFFDEAQFESYRALGFACATSAINKITDAMKA